MAYTENKKSTDLETKTTPIDADVVILGDSADSGRAKGLTWANVKATLKTYFDTLYMAIVTPGTSGNVLTSNGSSWVSQSVSISSTSGISNGPSSSSTQTITHGLGRIPKTIRLHGISKTGTGLSFPSNSIGYYTMSGNTCLYNTSAGTTVTYDNTFAVYFQKYVSGAKICTGVVQNVTATTFDIVWTNQDATDFSDLAFIWEAQ